MVRSDLDACIVRSDNPRLPGKLPWRLSGAWKVIRANVGVFFVRCQCETSDLRDGFRLEFVIEHPLAVINEVLAKSALGRWRHTNGSAQRTTVDSSQTLLVSHVELKLGNRWHSPEKGRT